MVKKKQEISMIVQKTLYEYLGEMLNVYPEAFLVFNLLRKGKVESYVEKCLPIIRRVTGSAIIDTTPIKTLFSLLVGGDFDPSYFSQISKMDENCIVFLNSLSTLFSFKESVIKKELNELPKKV
jgi:hypothetical protein